MTEQKPETSKSPSRIHIRHEFNDENRLLATVASMRIGNMIAVGITRANTDLEENPTEFSGECKAKARLTRFLQLAAHNAGQTKMKPKKIRRTENEIRRNLVFLMTPEEFKEKILGAETSPFLLGEACPFGGIETMTFKSKKRRDEQEKKKAESAFKRTEADVVKEPRKTFLPVGKEA